MHIIFLIILTVMFALVPILDALPSRKPKPDVITEKMQCRSYLRLIAFYWGFAAPVVVMSLIGGISPAEIGFRFINFNQNIWFTVIALIAGGLVFAYSVYEFIASVASKKFKEDFKEEYTNDNSGTLRIIPRTKKEKKLYSLVALSTAVCEETVYRGFLLFLLYAVFPGISVYIILLIAFVTFGVGHLYQGLKNAVSIGLFATVSMALLIATDSLIPVILLHFVGEASAIFALSPSEFNQDAQYKGAA
ncbi:MAG: CPBP family intramembrane metalloprotease [Defluviitaleaceae bacterium]|nr:CPBP family intramembrane metalloprotease [Defluviitaleaceae bacterium]